MAKSPVKARVRRFEVQIEGASVGRGEVDLDSLVAFGAHFQNALRRLVNVLEGKDAVAPGHPTASASAAARFRLVGIKKGSMILQLKTVSGDWLPGAADMAVVELARRVHNPRAAVDEGIVEALDEARQSLGATGSFRVRSHGMKTMVVDDRTVTRLRSRAVGRRTAESSIHTVSGWLHMADLQPSEFVIRTPTAIEWRCTFSPELKQVVLDLLDRIVVATGRGSLIGRYGRLDIESISAAPPVYQKTLEGSEEHLNAFTIPTSVRLQKQRGLGPEITRKDVDDLLASIEEANQ